MKTNTIQSKTKISLFGKSRKFLLTCGIVSSALYIIMNIVAAIIYDGYSSFSQTVSELSAIDAPTRLLWVPLGLVYTLLVAAFGWGILKSAVHNRSLQIAGTVLVVYGLIGIAWPPMHQREVLAAGGGTFTDTMHIVFSILSVVLMFTAMLIGSKALGKKFRYYSLVSVLTLLLLGAWTAMQAPKLQQNLPTPWLGVVERILILIFLVWVVVLAMNLLHVPKATRSEWVKEAEPSARSKNKRENVELDDHRAEFLTKADHQH